MSGESVWTSEHASANYVQLIVMDIRSQCGYACPVDRHGHRDMLRERRGRTMARDARSLRRPRQAGGGRYGMSPGAGSMSEKSLWTEDYGPGHDGGGEVCPVDR